MRPLLKILNSGSIRHFCTPCKTPRNVAKSIYFSKSTDIFTNLAVEDWLYKNMDFTNHHLLMLWQNEPCVVIGRHQNPWIECNFATLPNIENGVKLARRNSGGGTVYHDMKNLNLTFFTSREEYCRKKNLELISRALKKSFNIHSEISPREDLCIKDCKISGTASKLGRISAYHHCTVLVDANKENLSLALRNTLGNVKTNASISIKSKIMNLSEELPGITVKEVIKAVIMEFNNRSVKQDHFYLDIGIDGYDNFLQGAKIIESIDEEHFPGITEIKNTFLSTEWRFEKTPKFEIFRNIFSDFNTFGNNTTDPKTTTVFLTVEQGKVTNIGIKSAERTLSTLNKDLGDLCELFDGFIGKMFSKDVLDEFEMIVSGLRNSEICRTMVLNRN